MLNNNVVVVVGAMYIVNKESLTTLICNIRQKIKSIEKIKKILTIKLFTYDDD